MDDFHFKSYQKHQDHYYAFSKDGEQKNHANSWFETDTVDYWRHKRMYQTIDPILNSYPNSCWITIGDGRYGTDARYIQEKGLDVLATDISDLLLKESKQKGFIQKFEKQNAESLTFKDNQFDFAFCKEAYHHFPRPMISLYEMLRVSKKGVILVEPNDEYISQTIPSILFSFIKNVVKRILGKKIVIHDFEETGNYVFTISQREIVKVALGMNLKTIAFKGINDKYCEGVEFERLFAKSKLFRCIKRWITLFDLLTKLKLRQPSLLTAIIFKEAPSNDTIQKLKEVGYLVQDLPKNPYI